MLAFANEHTQRPIANSASRTIRRLTDNDIIDYLLFVAYDQTAQQFIADEFDSNLKGVITPSAGHGRSLSQRPDNYDGDIWGWLPRNVSKRCHEGLTAMYRERTGINVTAQVSADNMSRWKIDHNIILCSGGRGVRQLPGNLNIVIRGFVRRRLPSPADKVAQRLHRYVPSYEFDTSVHTAMGSTSIDDLDVLRSYIMGGTPFHRLTNPQRWSTLAMLANITHQILTLNSIRINDGLPPKGDAEDIHDVQTLLSANARYDVNDPRYDYGVESRIIKQRVAQRMDEMKGCGTLPDTADHTFIVDEDPQTGSLYTLPDDGDASD